MSQPIWSSTISLIGSEAADMLEAGIIILFGEPVPAALADVSVVHKGATAPVRAVAAGDEFVLGSQVFKVEEIGDRAMENLTELGHIVIYINQPEQELLPGAVKASGPEIVVPAAGEPVLFQEG